MPPVACNVCEYELPVETDGSAEAVMASGAADTLIVIGAEVLCEGLPLSLTAATNEALPPVTGVPEMTPVVLSERPAGKLPEATFQLYPGVPPVACNVALYGLPKVPGVTEDEEIFSATAPMPMESDTVAV